jgi:hypothetical protein
VFKRELSFEEQLTLTEEIVSTRAAELCRAYADVVGVSWGVRRRRGRVRRQPCVTFIVKRKRPLARVFKSARVPDRLFAYWTVRGVRKLCAVPTDVEDARERAAIRPSVNPVIARTRGSTAAQGVLAWAVERLHGPGKVYALSCRHVFSPVLRPRFVAADVMLKDSSAVLGETSRIAGHLRDDWQWSLDAQLAEVIDMEQLRLAVRGLRITDRARERRHIVERASFWVCLPTGPVRARFKEFVPPGGHPLDYEVPGARRVLHEQLVLVVQDTPTFPGDSGAPVLSTPGGGMLLGMHIGSNGEGLGLMIPAWLLIGPRGYAGSSDEDSWELWRAHGGG